MLARSWCLFVVFGCLHLVSCEKWKKMAEKEPSLEFSPRDKSPQTIDEAIMTAAGGKNVRHVIKDSRTGEKLIVSGLDMVLTPQQYERLYHGRDQSHDHDDDNTKHESAKATTTTTPHPSKPASAT